MLVYFELLAKHIVGVIVLLRLGMPLLVAEPYPSAADWTVPLFFLPIWAFFSLGFSAFSSIMNTYALYMYFSYYYNA